MIAAAKKSLITGIVLLVAGSIVVAYGTEAYVSLTEFAGRSAQPGLAAVSLVLNILRLTLLPLGAALVGAAVVIQSVAVLLTAKADDPVA